MLVRVIEKALSLNVKSCYIYLSFLATVQNAFGAVKIHRFLLSLKIPCQISDTMLSYVMDFFDRKWCCEA